MDFFIMIILKLAFSMLSCIMHVSPQKFFLYNFFFVFNSFVLNCHISPIFSKILNLFASFLLNISVLFFLSKTEGVNIDNKDKLSIKQRLIERKMQTERRTNRQAQKQKNRQAATKNKQKN